VEASDDARMLAYTQGAKGYIDHPAYSG